MGGVKIVLKQKVENNNLIFELPSEPYKSQIIQVLSKCNEKCNGFCSLTINRPYKPRTTGADSQNNLTWKLITIISNEMGEDVQTVEQLAKKKAISKGYPYKEVMGEVIPASMKEINTVECSYLIDTLYEMVAFLGIVLEPELQKGNEKTEVEDKQLEEQEEQFMGDIF